MSHPDVTRDYSEEERGKSKGKALKKAKGIAPASQSFKSFKKSRDTFAKRASAFSDEKDKMRKEIKDYGKHPNPRAYRPE